jgi:hypothetical protein
MEQLAMNDYCHIIVVDEGSREVQIFRLELSGKKTLYTRATLPVGSGWTENLESFAKMLGENILMDSPGARRALGI